MANKIKQEMDHIKIPRNIHERSKKGVLKAKTEMRGTGKRDQNYLPYFAAAVCLVLLIPLGLSYHSNHSHHPSAHSSVESTKNPVKNKMTNTEKDRVQTIRTLLKLEFTGPNEEFIKAFGLNSNQGPNFALISAYNKKYYQPLIAKDHYQEFINERYETFLLEPAYYAGYRLKPTKIEINKEKDNYSWEAEVEYTKDGKTKTSTVNGLISLNDHGRIITIKFINDGGLSNYFTNIFRKSNKNQHG